MSRPILIVEDETAIADTLAYALRTDGFAAHHVTLGQDALDFLQQAADPAALVVLDVGLPDLSGFDVLRRLRRFSNVPVIFLTARGDEIDRIVGLEIGADDYVSKPFSPRELVARIRAVLRRPPVPVPTPAFAPMHEATPAPTAAPMHAAPAPTSAAPARFALYADEARILYHGQPLNLTRYEFLLLKTLIERPGLLFSRAQLMDKVWHHAPETLERTVDAHVKSVRAKLRLINDSDDPIQTHRGMGYSLVRQ
jgi:two-component system catabolic regulation response regulator CreB